ncbi:MAG: GAF domain-containing protein [Chloroflexi bacterium]|nr:GAF domain-containing protein [Chloroflexota bacterium]
MMNRRPSTAPEAQSPAFDWLGWRENFILLMLRLALLFGIFPIVISFPASPVFARILFIGIYLLLAAVTLLRLPYLVRAYTLILTVFSVGMNAIIGWGPWADGTIFLLAAVVLSSILLDRRLDVVFLGVSIFSVLAVAILQQIGVVQTAAGVPAINPLGWAGYIIDFSAAGAVLVAGISQFKSTVLQTLQKMRGDAEAVTREQKRLEETARESREDLETRMEQIRVSSNAVRTIAGIQNIAELLDTTTQLISEKFGCYHAGLFILDEQRRNAYMQASSSVAGEQLIGRAFRLALDKKDPITLAVNTKQFVVTSDSDQRSFMRDPNFPLTRSRMILPLTVRNEVIGLLDIHSEQPQAFQTRDAEIMQTLADLTALSLDNVRLVNETKSLISQLEINAAIQTRRTWLKLTSKQKPAYQYTPAGVRPVFSPDKRVEPGDLLVPLTLQGQKIGTIKLKRKGGPTGWSKREQVLVGKIADQVALALENSRLVDEAQRNALQDQMIANISTQIRETLDIEAVIRTASSELRRVFDLKEAEIVVGPPQAEAPGRKNAP